jgi:V-type H+-transporting ATPase subunit D
MLAMIKARLAGATKGHALLKKKADALTIKFRQILKKIVDTKTKMGKSLKTSSFALTEAKYAAGDNVKHTIFDNVEAAQVRVKASTDNVAGVKLPKFEYVNDSTESKMDMTGLGKGGQQIQGCRQSYLKAVELLVDLASLQTSFLALDTAIKTTNRRVNALENVVKPKLENTIAYIKGELDELEREEFFRLKKVQAKKKRDMDAKEEAEKAAREKGITTSSLAPAYEAPSLLETVQDDDLLF